MFDDFDVGPQSDENFSDLEHEENLLEEYDGYDEPFDGYLTDAEADADALASAGYGTDEDYGDYGNAEFYDLDDY